MEACAYPPSLVSGSMPERVLGLPRRPAHLGRSATPPPSSSSSSSSSSSESSKGRAPSPSGGGGAVGSRGGGGSHMFPAVPHVVDTDQPRVNWTRINDLRCMVLLAHEAQRWQDMAEAMGRLVREEGGTFGRVEQYWLSVAYKNRIQPSRHAWQIMKSASSSTSPSSSPQANSLMHPWESSSSTVKEAVVRRYQWRVEAEVHQICREVMAIIEHLQTSPHHDAETEVFLYKMKGDYHRYAAEVTSSAEQREKGESEAIRAYEAGLELSKRMLPNASPLYLSLALNYAVFCCHGLRRPAQAIAIAQAAVERSGASPGLTALPRKDREDSASVRGLLAVSLNEWKAHQQLEVEERARMEAKRREEEKESERRRKQMEAQKEASGEPCTYGAGFELTLPPGLTDLPELG